jgi:hypothetical protein
MPVSKAVSRVTQSLLDDERTLLQESQRVDASTKAVLMRLANERPRFAEELERLNGQGSRESWGALVRELGRALLTRMPRRNMGEAVATCCRSQRRTEAHYGRALRFDLESEVKAVLISQQVRLRAAGAELAQLAPRPVSRS